MTMLAIFVGAFLLGGTPTADWLAERAGVDLRTGGSKNPGANNALRLGGRRLAAMILGAELVKGVLCVTLGIAVGGEAGMSVSGVGAVLGNVASPYRSFRGGQGLGIAAGVLAAALPLVAAAGIATITTVALTTRKTALAALAALLAIILSAAWMPIHPWGITDTRWSTFLAVGLSAVIAPKQIRKVTRSDRPPRPAEA